MNAPTARLSSHSQSQGMLLRRSLRCEPSCQSLGVQMKSTKLSKRAAANTYVLCSPAWLLRRLSDSSISFIAQEPGTAWDWQLRKLERVAGRPGFTATLKAGSAVALFNEPLTEIRVRSPWYYFSGGLILQIRGQSYRVSFGEPVGSFSDGSEWRAAYTMRYVGKRWLKALTTCDSADA